MLHEHGSGNPNGVTASGDRYAMHPYFIFKLRRFGMVTHPSPWAEQGRLCVRESRTTYLGTEGNLVLNRACMQKVFENANQLAFRRSVQLDKVRAKLPKFQFSFHPHKGGYLSCKEIIQSIFRVGFKDSEFTHSLGSCTKSTIKKMNGKPKSKCSRSHINSGPAKASNSYAVRGLGVAVDYRYGVLNGTRSTLTTSLRSSPILNFIREHSTGTGSSINVLSRLRDLHERSKEYPNLPIDRDLYKTFILNKDMYLMAYNRLNSKPDNMTPCISPVSFPRDINFTYFIEALISELKSEAFSFSPGIRIMINKASGGKIPLTIGDTRDKLVQEIIRIVLESIYEPIFKETSFGFRPKLSCHTALKYVFSKFKGCAWWIEGNLKGYYAEDKIPHDKLMVLLSTKIKDQRFIQLIRKYLKAGFSNGNIQDNRAIYDIVGTPQGSILSPILANIYLHQLDEFVENLKTDFDISGRQQPILRKLQWQITKAKREGDFKRVIQLAADMKNNFNKFNGS